MGAEARRIGFIGPTQSQDFSKLTQRLREEVSWGVEEIISAGNIIVVYAGLGTGLTSMVIEETLKRDPLLKHLMVVLPTSLKTYLDNRTTAARNSGANVQVVKRIEKALQDVNTYNPSALVELDAARFGRVALDAEEDMFMELIQGIHFFGFGILTPDCRQSYMENDYMLRRVMKEKEEGFPIAITDVPL